MTAQSAHAPDSPQPDLAGSWLLDVFTTDFERQAG
jgi:hypothetical protein